ncbi:MAG: hypothetical protein ACOX52_00685 [Verrucomicrobiota bacterium]
MALMGEGSEEVWNSLQFQPRVVTLSFLRGPTGRAAARGPRPTREGRRSEISASRELLGIVRHISTLGPETYTYTAKRYTYPYTRMGMEFDRERLGEWGEYE